MHGETLHARKLRLMRSLARLHLESISLTEFAVLQWKQPMGPDGYVDARAPTIAEIAYRFANELKQRTKRSSLESWLEMLAASRLDHPGTHTQSCALGNCDSSGKHA